VAHLVFQTAFPGDLFLSIPLIKRIKDWDPQGEVVLACRPGLGEFFKETGLADEIITINKRDKTQSAQALNKLSARPWDVVFVPHESVRTALWMLRLKARHKVSFAQWWNRPFYDKRVVKPVNYPDALRQLSLLTPLDSRLAEHFGHEDLHELQNPAGRQEAVDLHLPYIPEWASMQIMTARPEGRAVFIAPGSTWNTKRWTAGGYKELAKMILDQGYTLELVGSKDEKILCDEIEAAVLAARPGASVKNHAGRTSLNDLVKLFRRGTALVSNDSGAMHAAAVTGLPTVAIFGPTTLNLGFRPWQNRAMVVQKDLDCRPCGKHGHQKCPLGHHHCMEKIEAGEVLRAFLKVSAS